MDDDFRILFDYVEQMKRELQDEADLQTKSDEDEEKKCVHESIETEEAYVCLRFDDVERRMMQDLISSYRAGLDWNTSDLENYPFH